MTRSLVPFFAVSCLAFAGCIEPIPVPEPEFPLETQQNLEGALRSAMNTVPAWGCHVGVAGADESFEVSVGDSGPTEDALPDGAELPIASISKTFVAGLVLTLLQDGELQLDDTLQQHLPGVHPRADEITLEMLLIHTAGLPEFFGTTEFVADQTRAWTEDELFAFVADDPLVNEPGASYAYSNTHYSLLARVAEAQQGTPWRELLAGRILDPIGLAQTRVPALGAGWDVAASSWFGDSPVTLLVHPQAAGGAGNVIATAHDVARYTRARFAGGLLDAEWTEDQLDGVPIGAGANYGLGVVSIGDEVGHDGALNGFASYTAYREDLGVSIALLCNAWGANPVSVSYPYWLVQDLWEELD